MKNKLITFEVEEISLPYDRPYIKRVYPKGAPFSLSPESSELTYMRDENIVEKIFERIVLHDPVHPTKNASYFVNFEDASYAMPILKGLLDSQSKTLRKQHIDDLVEIAYLKDIVKKYRSFWFNRLWDKITSKYSNFSLSRIFKGLTTTARK